LQQKSWDPSVKSLAPFPRILRMLDANLEWTERLGEAYLADPAAVMDAVQRLRRRAQLAGRLVTTPQENVRIEQQPTRIDITIEPETPEVVYVPICDPSFAYGPWPYPDYPPFFPLFAGAARDPCCSHQSSYPLPANREAISLQFGMNTRRAIGSMRPGVDRADATRQIGVGGRPSRNRSAPPSIIARG
jgi:Protein of unknown function (DUF3300)